MPVGDQLEDPAQRDLAWVGYDPRATAPAVALAAFVNVLVMTGRWYLDEISELADRVGALAVFALAFAVWPGLAAVFLYRTVTYTYRLTDRAVLVDLGFMFYPIPPLKLKDAIAVDVGSGWLARWFGVGWVEVRTKDQTLRMTGIRRPASFAEKIQKAMLDCRNR